jgi:5-methylcytosine-specific restriction endonuclease McrA
MKEIGLMSSDNNQPSPPITRKAYLIGVLVLLLSIGFVIGGNANVRSAELDIKLNQSMAHTGNLLPGFRTTPLTQVEKFDHYLTGGIFGIIGALALLLILFGTPLTAADALYDYLWNREKFNKEWRSSAKSRNIVWRPSSESTEHPYGPEWEELARSIRKRDGYQCRMWGSRNMELHVHYLISRSQGGPDSPENLVTLCKDCHNRIHPHMQGR